MRTPKRFRILHIPAAIALLLASPAGAQTVEIDNGLAPPNPANVITTGGFFQLVVRDGGCAGEPTPCPSPGSPTTVEVQAPLGLEISVFDSSVASLTFGFNERADAWNQSTIEVDGGTLDWLVGHDQSTIAVNSGGTSDFAGRIALFDQATLLMPGGGTQGLQMNGSSSGEISGGRSTNEALFVLNDQASLLISGGVVGCGFCQILARDQSVLTVTGGQILDSLVAQDSAVIRIAGMDFSVDGVPVGLGPLPAGSGILSGTLADGTSIERAFTHRTAGATGTIVLIPEPSTAALLAGGLLVLGSRGRSANRQASASARRRRRRFGA